MARSIKNLIFGGDIPLNIKQKLSIRQQLSKSPDFGEAVNQTIEKYDSQTEQGFSEYENNFQDGKNVPVDLSSRTPFARMWTAVSVYEDVDEDRELQHDEEVSEFKEIFSDDPNYFLRKKGDVWEVHKWIELQDSNRIYEVGNHILNTEERGPNQPISKGSGDFDSTFIKDLVPFEQETDMNAFLKPTAGITSVSSETTGPMGLTKTTTINFVVHNFSDLEKIYLRYFLRPGSQIFVDFGWDTANLYDIQTLVNSDDFEEGLYGEKGAVTLSNGDMETLFGNVINYDIKVREDGGFNCSLEFVSKNGALLQGNLKEPFKDRVKKGLDIELLGFVASSLTGLKKYSDAALKWNTSQQTEDELRVFFKEKLKFEGAQTYRIPGIQSSTYSVDCLELGIYFTGFSDTSMNIYISYGFFEDKILNREFGFGQTKGELVNQTAEDAKEGEKNLSAKFNSKNSFVTYDKTRANYQKQVAGTTRFSYLYPDTWGGYSKTYNTIRNMIPDDRQVSNDGTGRLLGVETPVMEFQEDLDKRNNKIPLREIFISVETIKTAVSSATSVEDILKKIAADIKEDSNDTIDLIMSSNNYGNNTIALIDKNMISPKRETTDDMQDLFMFHPYSPTTIVKGYDLAFTMPKGGLGDMIAIQNTGNFNIIPVDALLDQIVSVNSLYKIKNENSEYFVKYNPKIGDAASNRLQDNTNADRAEAFNFAKDDIFFEENLQNKLGWNVFSDKKAQQQLDQMLENATDDDKDLKGEKIKKTEETNIEDSSKVAKELADKNDDILADNIAAYYDKLSKTESVKSVSPIVSFLELTLKIYGISGLSPGQILRVDYLPQTYIDNVYFQIVGVSHDIGNTWDTTLTTQMKVLSQARENSLPTTKKKVVLNKSFLTKTLNLKKIQPYMHLLSNLTVADDASWRGDNMNNYPNIQFKFHGRCIGENKENEIVIPEYHTDLKDEIVEQNLGKNAKNFTSLTQAWNRYWGFEAVWDSILEIRLESHTEIKTKLKKKASFQLIIGRGGMWILIPGPGRNFNLSSTHYNAIDYIFGNFYPLKD